MGELLGKELRICGAAVQSRLQSAALLLLYPWDMQRHILALRSYAALRLLPSRHIPVPGPVAPWKL